MNDDFEKADWGDLYPRLLAYARFVLAKYKRDAGPAGKTAIDYVHRAVVDVVGNIYAPKMGRSPFAKIAAVIYDLIRRDMEK